MHNVTLVIASLHLRVSLDAEFSKVPENNNFSLVDIGFRYEYVFRPVTSKIYEFIDFVYA